MLTLSDLNLRATLPTLAAEAPCKGICQGTPELCEAILAQAEAKDLKQVPGSPLANAAEPCRTCICDCTEPSHTALFCDVNRK